MCAQNLLNKIFLFNPDIDFLSYIITFEAVIIAIAIPLSFEMVSRISERYQSEVITKKFLKEWDTKLLPFLSIFHIIFATILRFTIKKNFEPMCWGTLALINILLFIFIAIITTLYIKKVIKYISNPEFIMKKLFEDAKNAIK